MEKESMHVSQSGYIKNNQAATQESPNKSVQCNHCTLHLKSKVYLFEHLNMEHGFDVDISLSEAGLKSPGKNKTSSDNNSNNSDDSFECQHCDFKACSQDILNKHEEFCQMKLEHQTDVENIRISENPETTINLPNQHKEFADAEETSSLSLVMPTLKTKCTLESSKDLKTYTRPLQTITKYFGPSFGSSAKQPVNFSDSSKGTLILQNSPPGAGPKSSGVLKVTAKPTIDLTKIIDSSCFLLDDHVQISDLRTVKPNAEFKETVPTNTGKRMSKESWNSTTAKKAKLHKVETELPEKTNSSTQQSSSPDFSFEISEDEEEKRTKLVSGVAESPQMYFCKHCDHSDVSIRSISIHYLNNHPYIRCSTDYIQDPSDRSASFCCLECPVEFVGETDLKGHYMENHPDAPNVFTKPPSFVCPFTTTTLKALKKHYKEKYPKHKVDNSLMYSKYSATRCQKGPPQLEKCEKSPSPESPRKTSHESACSPCKENAPSPQHPIQTSNQADVALYHCNNCVFSHKSVVVMHVHYQKSHPDEAVTIDKIKQSTRITSNTMTQVIPVKSPNPATVIKETSPPKPTSDSSKETKNYVEPSQQRKTLLTLVNPEHTPIASKIPSKSAKTEETESTEDRRTRQKSSPKGIGESSPGMDSLFCSSPNELFYCRFCSFSSSKIKSVVGHHNAKHSEAVPINIEGILRYTAEVKKNKLQSNAKASAQAKTSKQVGVCRKLRRERNKAADVPVKGHNAYAVAEKLFYCQKCNYGNPSAVGVSTHQAKIHHIPPNLEHIMEYTALIRDEMEKLKSPTNDVSSAHLPLPLINEGDENRLFCPLCNYRHTTMTTVSRHCKRQHCGLGIKIDEISSYTSMVLAQTKKSSLKTTASQDVNQASIWKKGNMKKKTKNLGKVLGLVSVRALQAQRTLRCHRCTYMTHNLHLLRRHMHKIHKASSTVADVLRVCFKQGSVQAGYHCDLCAFSHKKAAAVFQHYKDYHPGRKVSLEYVTTRLYVGPETCAPMKKKPKIKQTDENADGDDTDCSISSQRSGQNESRTYSCKACSFKGGSVSSITRHYRAVHPWAVKEDGSVLYLINSKKQSASRQVEDQNEMLESFEAYQAPLEFENSAGSLSKAAFKKFQCSHCPARFNSQRGVNTHFGIKHHELNRSENIDEQQEEQVPSKAPDHVFICPHCTYVNTNYQGVLTHCQMKHPDLESRAESLHLDEAHLRNWEDCVIRKGPGLRLCGYMCKTCPQIYATQDKLNKHCVEGHDENVAVSQKPISAPKPSAVSNKTHKTICNQGSVSKVSFLNKKTYYAVKCQYCSYSCSTKLGISRHMQDHHKNASVLKRQDSLHRCALCPKFYFRKKRLANHYAKKHGKEAFLKYYAPMVKKVHEKPVLTVTVHHSTEQAEDTKACKSTTEDEDQQLAFKCPSCPYVNASYHGTLTHCQMRHPDVVARADELQTCEIRLTNMVGCTVGKGANVRGYSCKKCPKIYASMKKLKIHHAKEHNDSEATASKHSVETDSEEQHEHGSHGSVLEAVSLKKKTPAVGTVENSFNHQVDPPETCQPTSGAEQKRKSVYKCSMCTYTGSCRKYLYCHYKKTHKLDAFMTCKLLQRYNKYRLSKSRDLTEAEISNFHCKMCPKQLNSSELLIAHYKDFHGAGSLLDFVVLSQASKKSTGLYRCSLCKKQINGMKKLCHHLDSHRMTNENMAKSAKTKESLVTATPEAKSMGLSLQDELPMLETVEELAQWNLTPVETFTMPPSPVLSPSKSTNPKQLEPELGEDKTTCKQCGRSFMSLKGLRSHERSHAAVAAIKKLNKVSTSVLKHKVNKYILYKEGTVRPFLCSICGYRTTHMDLWRNHFMKKHQDVFVDLAETENQDQEDPQGTDEEEPPYSPNEFNYLPELEEEPTIAERSLYLEPQDVQRQLNHYSLVAQAGAPCKATGERTTLVESSFLHCEICNFSTEHLSSMRRHYLNRHGKRMLRCKDCEFYTVLKKTLEMHMKTGHSTFQSEPTHQKDLRCPFCLYQTKNKNSMIDHIVLHREERVVPIEVRRPKLSRYLYGIVFRCHKCTFTSGSAENLRLHVTKHDDIKPYKCRLCYFDCTRLSDLEAHLSDKHQVLRNHELVGQISLDQLEARVHMVPEEEPLSDTEHHNNNNCENVKNEEFVTDSDDVPEEKQANDLAENNNRETVTVQVNKAYRSQRQGGKIGNEESPAMSSALDLQYEDTNPNIGVQKKQEIDPQEQADTANRQGIENTAEEKEIQYEHCNDLEKDRQTNASPTQLGLRDGEGISVTFTQRKEGCSRKAEGAEAHKLHVKVEHRTANIEARIEDNILRHVLMMDEDGSIHKTHKKADQDRTIKMEQNIEPEVDGAVSTNAKTTNQQANNIKAQERFTAERHLLTLVPNCGRSKMNHDGILSVSFTKEKLFQNQKDFEEVKDPYGEMPTLKNECVKEEMQPVGCCKEEDLDDYFEPQQDKDEMMAQCSNPEHQDGGGIKKTEDQQLPEGTLGATTEEKRFTCEYCGRNLINSFELERHITRHGL